jgi:GT2 family glycosyltransferase
MVKSDGGGCSEVFISKNKILSKTAVVILNWNGKAYLERFLPILIQNTPNAEIVVADNASSDDSAEFMKTYFPEVRFIQNDKNYGFAEGYNLALSEIETKYYVLLNSDIEVTPGWLEPLRGCYGFRQKHSCLSTKNIGFLQQKTLFEYAGASGGFIDKNGFPFCRGRLFNTLEEDHGQYDDLTDIFWASGACLAVRSDMWKKAGGLDPDFFAHMEEIDFCWRLHNMGKRIVVVPKSKVYHIGGGTLPKKSSKKTYLNFRNNYLLLYKNLPSGKLFSSLTLRLFLDWLAAVKFLTEGNAGDFLAVFKAQLHTFFSFGKHKHKRKNNSKFSRKLIYDRSIIFAYFFRKIKKFSDLDSEDFL